MTTLLRSVLLTVLLALVAGSDAEELSPRQRFEQQAPDAWNEYMQWAVHVEGKCSSTKLDHVTRRVLLKEGPCAFKVNELSAIIPLNSPQQEKAIRLECQNLDYEFVVEEQPNGTWKVLQLLWKDRVPEAAKPGFYYDPLDGTIGHEPWQLAAAYSCRGLLLNTTWLPYLASSPDFEVLEAQQIADPNGKGDLVHIEFKHNALRGEGITVESGFFVLDASRSWQIHEAHMKAFSGVDKLELIYEVKNVFSKADKRFSYASHQVLRTHCPSVVDTEDRYLTTLQPIESSDVASFRLPAFGIPEPVMPVDQEL